MKMPKTIETVTSAVTAMVCEGRVIETLWGER
jgi:hypothetical protein